jgi:hypothetical protein
MSSSSQQQQQQQQQQLKNLQSVDLTNFMNSPTSSLKNLLNSLDCSRIFDHKSMPKMQLKQRKESFPVIKFDELDQTIRQKFLTELKNYSTGKKSNVFYFYHDDAFVSNKSLRSKDDDGYDDGYGFKYVPNLNEKRRRVFAYVWVQENGFNYIFYGGCVFNPTKSEKSIPYNKKGERQTALSRLETMPVIMASNAKNYLEVREQICKAIFSLGVKDQVNFISKNGFIKLAKSQN